MILSLKKLNEREYKTYCGITGNEGELLKKINKLKALKALIPIPLG